MRFILNEKIKVNGGRAAMAGCLAMFCLLLFLFAGCGSDEKELALQVEAAPQTEEIVSAGAEDGAEDGTEDGADDAEALSEPFFQETSQVTYEALMSCFRAEYLLSVSSYVRRDRTFADYSTGDTVLYAAEYGWFNGYLAEHRVCEHTLESSYEEVWTGYDGHSIVTYYSDEYSEGIDHTVYPNLDFYRSSGVFLVTDFRSMTEPVLVSTEPLENGLYRSTVEYRSGGSLYAFGIYEYDPVYVVLSSYEEIFYYGAGKAVARETGTIVLSDEIAVDFDPAAVLGYDSHVQISYDGTTCAVMTCGSETLRFSDLYSTDGVLDYRVFDSNGQLIYSGYDFAVLGSPSADGTFLVESTWLETYPQEPGIPASTAGITGSFLTGTWVDNLAQPSYSVVIGEDLSFVCSRFAEDGTCCCIYTGTVLTGSFGNIAADTFDYLELSLAETADSFFQGLDTLGDFCIVKAAENENFCELRLVPADEFISLFRAYYSNTSPVWYKAVSADPQSVTSPSGISVTSSSAVSEGI